MSESVAHAEARKRRWYQFSLRTLLVLVLLLSMPLAWIGRVLEKTRREQAVVAKIEMWGGKVEYHESALPPWIARHVRQVRRVEIADFDVTDVQLAHLKELPALKALYSWGYIIDGPDDEDVVRIQNALPGCELDWGGWCVSIRFRR